MEKGLTRNQILSELVRSSHGNIKEYVPVGQQTAEQDPEFLAHLIAWNQLHGQIRDSKVALPVVSLSVASYPKDLAANSMAHIALLRPKQLIVAYRFAREIKTPGYGKELKRLVGAYLRNNLNSDRSIVRHRKYIQELCSITHQKPTPKIDSIVFGPSKKRPMKEAIPEGSVFDLISKLSTMAPTEAAGVIMQHQIPFLTAHGAIKRTVEEMKNNPDLVQALIKTMTPTEVETNTNLLNKLGLKTNPALRAAYEEALGRVGKSKKSTFKASRAAEAEGMDEELKAKLHAVQEKKIKALAGIEGDWLVLGDKSGSMSGTIKMANEIAATLAKMVKGKVSLIFFDTSPTTIDATDKTYEQLRNQTKNIRAVGGTSIGCGLLAAIEKGTPFNGIAIVSDGLENTHPSFATEYARYCQSSLTNIPVYFYCCRDTSTIHHPLDRPLEESMKKAGFDLQIFDVSGKTDYYSLPNLVATMRTSRYSLIDEIMETPLLTLGEVFKQNRGDGREEVLNA